MNNLTIECIVPIVPNVVECCIVIPIVPNGAEGPLQRPG